MNRTAPDGSSSMASAPLVGLAAGSVNSLLVTDATSGSTVRVAGLGLLLAAAVGLGLIPAAACGVLPHRSTVAVRA